MESCNGLRMKRFLALLLSAAMICTSMGTDTFAAASTGAGNPVDASLNSVEPAGDTSVSVDKTENGYKLSNDYFTVETGKYGEISSLKIKGDEFDTNYVMNAENAKAQDTPGHEWLGELMFNTKVGNAASWHDERTQSSDSGRKVTLLGNKVIVTYQNSTETKGISDMLVTETYTLDGSKLRWDISLKNTNSQSMVVGDLGLPLPFNEFWTANDEIYETRAVDHSFVGKNGSYIYVTRPSGQGRYLLMTPDASTGAGFEYQDHWRTDERDSSETAWCQDQSGWQNGLNVFYIHSDAIKKTGRGYLPNTSLTLAAGEEKTYSFNFQSVADESAMKEALYKEGLIDAVAVPGMTFAKSMPAKIYLHTKYSKDDIKINIQCPHELALYDGKKNTVSTSMNHTKTDANTYAKYEKTVTKDGEQYLVYDLKFDELGQHNMNVTYDGGKKTTTFQFYIMDDAATAIGTHSNFMVDKTQLNMPGETGDGVFDDWMMDNKATRSTTDSNYFNESYWGWGDDWGLTHGTFLAEKNVYQPVAKEISALDKYLDTAIWNGLMQEHHNDYLIHDFLMVEPNASPTYRGYAYPHIYNTYFMMYKIASKYPDMIKYKETADTYLMRAYNIMNAYYNGDGVSYNWGTGVMGESTTPAIIAALRAEGHDAEADNIVTWMNNKYQKFKDQTYPYGSEYSYDNTGEEAVYVLAKLQKEAGNDTDNAQRMMKAINLKTRACRGSQPIWYEYADPVTNCGENWWQFQYSTSLIGYCMDDYLRLQDNEYTTAEAKAVAERENYAAKLANLTCINSGQIDSQAENIGASAWTYQAEMGNLGGQGTGGGSLHNGWRQMTGESDLGLFGALQILSSDVETDPIFGLFGYSCNVSEADGKYTVTPLDGLYTKLNFIDEKLYIELERDQYTKAVAKKDKTEVDLSMKNLEGTAHTSNISVTGLDKGSYGIRVDGTVQGKFTVSNDEAATVPVKLTAASTAEVEIVKGLDYTGKVTVNAGEDQNVKLSDEIKLVGTAEDTASANKTPAVKWTVESAPENGSATIKTASNLRTYVSVNKTGKYVFTLTATESGVSDNVAVNVSADDVLPEHLVEYTFDDISGNVVKTSTDSGINAAIVGKVTIGKGKLSTNGISIFGSNSNGYIRLSDSKLNRLDAATIAVDVKLSAVQSSGASIFTIADTEGNKLAATFAQGNEIAITANDKTENTGIILANGYWKNIALTVSKNEIKLFVDGKEKYTMRDSSFAFTDLGTSQYDYLGRGVKQSDAFLNGVIDNYELYSKALDAETMLGKFKSDVVSKVVSANAGIITTAVGSAPVLPKQVKVLYSDGIYEKRTVSWDAIDPASYAAANTFTIAGTIDGLTDMATATIRVVKGKLKNIAAAATATAIIDSTSDLGGVAGLNDGYEPESSSDTSHGAWHNWHGAQSAAAWVEYTWKDAVVINSADAYYFKDGGGNFYPASAEYYYLDSDGVTWLPVQNAEGLGVALNQYNRTSFEAVETKGLKMVMTPGKLGCGVIEWKVYGYTEDDSADKTELNAAVSAAESYNSNVITSGYDALTTALTKAKAVAADKYATQDEADEAVANLTKAEGRLIPRNGNYAYIAQKKASFTSGWERLDAVNDGNLPKSSYYSDYSHWGTWGNQSASESITYSWPVSVNIAVSKLYLWYDGDEGYNTSGGILYPKSYSYQYLDSDGNWQNVQNAKGLTEEMDAFSTTTFSSVNTKAIKVTMNKQNEDSNGVGVHEWEIYAKETVDNTKLAKFAAAVSAADIKADGYTSASYKAFTDALTNAYAVLADSDAGQSDVDSAYSALNNALNGLVKGSSISFNNIAPDATASASYTGDEGSASNINDQDESTGWSTYTSDRTKIPAEVQAGLVWSKKAAVSSADIYFMTSVSTTDLPSQFTISYRNDEGSYVQIGDAVTNIVSGDYVHVDFGETVSTDAISMNIAVKAVSADSVSTDQCGVGINEMKVNGAYIDDTEIPVSVNKITLNLTYEAAKEIDPAKYSKATFAVLSASINAAKTVIDKADATQAECDEAVLGINSALNSLIIIGDKTELNTYISGLPTVSSDTYVKSTVETYTAALNSAKEILALSEPTQSELDTVLTALKNAYSDLRTKADTSELETLMTSYSGITLKGYTTSSYNVFKSYYDKAAAAVESGEATKIEISSFISKLKKAYKALKAAWKVTFDSQGGSKLDIQEVLSGDSTYVLPEPDREGYHFIGWYSEENGQGSQLVSGTVLSDDVSVYAYWIKIRTLSFDAGAGTVSQSSITIDDGKCAVLPVPVRIRNSVSGNRYDFIGWFTEENGEGTQITDSTPITSDMTLYAYWKISSTANAVVLSDSNVKFVGVKAQTYDNTAKTPAFTLKYVYTVGKSKKTVTLKVNEDYTVSYRNNKAMGTATIKISGIDNYSGSASATFRINARNIGKANITVADVTNVSAPQISIRDFADALKLTEGTDYTVVVDSAKKKLTVSGQGNYTGKVTKSYKVIRLKSTEQLISADGISLDKAEYAYTGKAIRPGVTVKDSAGNVLKERKDYSLTYKSNTNAGTAKVIIKGKGRIFKGTVTKYFTITPISIKNGYTLALKNNVSSFVYTGRAVTPAVKVTYTLNKKTKQLAAGNYTVTYRYNTYADDKATVTVTGKGNYTGTLTQSISITAKDISRKGITVKFGKTAYDKKNNITAYPAVTVKYMGKTLKAGTDYEALTAASFDLSNQSKGKATVTIKAVSGSDFTGTLTKTFNVKKPKK